MTTKDIFTLREIETLQDYMVTGYANGEYTHRSQEYWIDRNKREKIIIERTANKTSRKIASEYVSVYNKTVAEYKNLYLQLEDKIKNGGTLSRTDLYTLDRYYKLQNELKEQCTNLGIKEEQLLTDSLVGLYDNTYLSAVNDIMAIGGKRLTMDVAPPRALVEAMVKTPWTSDGKMFSQRIWLHQAQLVNGLNDTFTTMVLQGKKWGDISKALQSQFGVAKYQCDRLVRTEMAHTYITAEHEGYRKAGVDKVKVISYNCCDECDEYNGNIYFMDEIEIPFHPNCRCDTIPVFDDGDDNE